MTRQKIWDTILVIFSIYWTVFFLLDYWDKHPNHVLAFQYFRYTKLCTFLVLMGGGLSYLVTRFRTGLISKFYNGISIYVIGIIIVTAITLSYNKYLNVDIGISNYFHLYGRLSLNFITGYFVILSCFSIGNFVLNRYYTDVIKRKHFTYDFGLGAIIITMLLFFIGVIGQLKLIVVLPILLLFIGINYKGSFDFVVTTFVRPFKIKKSDSPLGFFCLFVLFAFLVLNLYYIDYPFPLGFDSRNLYINIPKEIGLSNSLIAGNPPYNWSLFLSLGFVIFERVETVLFLSAFTGVLCLAHVYHICIKIFKFDFSSSALTILIIGTIPTIANQFFVELKTDFGLLFFQLIAFSLLLGYVKSKLKTKPKLRTTEIKLFALLGLILGFSLGIKLLSLLLIFGIYLSLYAFKGNFRGTIGIFLIMFSLVIILGINNISGLGKSHLGNSTFKWVYLISGLLLFASTYLSNRNHFIKYCKIASLISIFALIPFSPWMIKNYTEVKSGSPMKILTGAGKGAIFDWEKVTQGMENSTKE